MTGTATYAMLRARYDADRDGAVGNGTAAAEARLARALDAIGWRAANGADAEEVAPYAAEILHACVTDHRDVSIAVRDLAELLHACAAPLDGSMYPAAAFEPAADQVLWRYASG
ncbi:MAG: hypothetical protein ABJE47_18790 [bacterium]